MGYKLYASMGTADFYTEHGVEVSEKNVYWLLHYAEHSIQLSFMWLHVWKKMIIYKNEKEACTTIVRELIK